MLDVAIRHKEELISLFQSIWFEDRYKYWNYDSYFQDISIKDDTWNQHQFVSLDNEGKVRGYIGYSVRRDVERVYELSAVNFNSQDLAFGLDLKQALEDIFLKYNFNKINFTVVIGNPAEKHYDSICKKLGGRIVGTRYDDTKLFDGKLYDVKLYEILKSDFEKNRKVRPKTT